MQAPHLQIGGHPTPHPGLVPVMANVPQTRKRGHRDEKGDEGPQDLVQASANALTGVGNGPGGVVMSGLHNQGLGQTNVMIPPRRKQGVEDMKNDPPQDFVEIAKSLVLHSDTTSDGQIVTVCTKCLYERPPTSEERRSTKDWIVNGSHRLIEANMATREYSDRWFVNHLHQYHSAFLIELGPILGGEFLSTAQVTISMVHGQHTSTPQYQEQTTAPPVVGIGSGIGSGVGGVLSGHLPNMNL